MSEDICCVYLFSKERDCLKRFASFLLPINYNIDFSYKNSVFGQLISASFKAILPRIDLFILRWRDFQPLSSNRPGDLDY